MIVLGFLLGIVFLISIMRSARAIKYYFRTKLKENAKSDYNADWIAHNRSKSELIGSTLNFFTSLLSIFYYMYLI